MNEIKKNNGWVVYIDIYGFSALIKESSNIEEIHYNLLKCYNDISQYVCSDNSCEIKLFFFSDSTFIIYPVTDCADKDKTFKICRNHSAEILSIFIKHSFPARGGNFFWRDMLQ